MIYFGIGIALAVILVVGWVVLSFIPDVADGEDTRPFKRLLRIGLALGCVSIFVIVTLASSIKTVPAGHVGLVYTFGDITGQRAAGFQLIAPWQGFKTASVQVQTLCFMEETETKHCPEGSRKMGSGLDSFSEETQNVFIDAIVNIKVDPDNVQSLYREVGERYVDKLIPGRVAQVFKDETVNYTSIEIAPAREELRRTVEPSLRDELRVFSIDVVALLVENIRFNPAFEDAIEQKQIASQEALAEGQRVEAARQRAQQTIEHARGEAESNHILAESLRVNGNYIIQFRAIEKLADDIKIMILPTDSGLLPIISDTLLGGGSSQPTTP